jgi:uncharacterized protein YtpQ (UPF0354 family)
MLSTTKSRPAIGLFTLLLLLAGCMKSDPASVRGFVQEQILEQFPEVTFEEAGDSEIAVRHKDGNRQLIDIAPIQEGCKRVPKSCGGLVGRLLVVMQEGITSQATDISLSQLLPLISAPAPSKGLVQQNAPGRIYAQPIAENLAVRFAVSTGDTFTLLDEEKIAKLGGSPEVLLKEALKNADALAIVNLAVFPGEASVFQVFGRLAGSGILTRTSADRVKTQLKCRELAIAFPRRGMVLAACATDAVNVARLREISARFLQPASAVISSDIYLLTDGGLSMMKK